jgi:glycosyltransferase involved in cell wall biosynthesis
VDILISVIICTYNRSDYLKKAIQSLVNQTLDRSFYEILVIDNHSTDDTKDIVNNEFSNVQNLRYIFEPIIGLSQARNTGWKKGKGEFIAYLDDDAQASKDWLHTALNIFTHTQPEPLCIGGPILPYYDSPKPAWFEDVYEIRKLGEQPRFLRPSDRLFSGSNMIFRKEILEYYGGFDTDFGVRGEYLSLGEEDSLFLRIWNGEQNNTKLYYSPELMVFHLVPTYKMTLSYQFKRKFVAGISAYKLHSNDSFGKRIRLLIEIIYNILMAFIQAIIHRDTFVCYEDWAMKTLSPVPTKLGWITASLGLSISIKQQ